MITARVTSLSSLRRIYVILLLYTTTLLKTTGETSGEGTFWRNVQDF